MLSIAFLIRMYGTFLVMLILTLMLLFPLATDYNSTAATKVVVLIFCNVLLLTGCVIRLISLAHTRDQFIKLFRIELWNSKGEHESWLGRHQGEVTATLAQLKNLTYGLEKNDFRNIQFTNAKEAAKFLGFTVT